MPISEELSSSVANTIRNLERRSGRWFGCYCVAVRSDDGMSWSAEAVRRKVAADYPFYETIPLPSRRASNSLPDVGKLIGETELLKTAVRHKLAKWYPTLYPYQIPLLVLGIFALGVLIAIGTGILKIVSPATAGQANLFASPVFWVVAGLLALLPLLSKLLTDRFSLGQKEKSIQLFRDHIAEFERLDQPPQAYENFIEALAEKMRRMKNPRIVIIDNYERMDRTTRGSIQRYLRSFSEHASGSEFWVIFEGQDGQTYSQIAYQDRHSYTFSQTKFWQQQALDPKVLQDLAVSLGRADQPTFTSVKWVCRGTPAGNKRMVTFLEEYRRDHPFKPERYGDLDFFYLLTMAAAPGEVAFRRQELQSLLSQTKLERTDVLKLILRGTGLTKAEFQTRLRDVERSFNSLMSSPETDPEPTLGFLPETANILQTIADKLQLPDKGLVHLYWTLFWYDRHPQEAYLLRKLIYHLILCDASQCPPPLARLMGKKLFEVSLYAIDKSLKTCLFKELPKLLERAIAFYETKGSQEPDRSRDRIIRRCWDVYSVLGDEYILALMLRVQELLPEAGIVSEQHEPGLQLEEIFLQATWLEPDLRENLRKAFHSWGAGRRGDGSSLRYNAIVRAGWLLSSVVTLGSRGIVEQSLFGRAFAQLDSLPTALDQTCQKLVREKSEFPMLTDVMTLSLSLWSLALMTSPEGQGWEPFIGMAETALIVAAELKEKTFGSNMDAILHALSREVCTVAMASILTVYHRVARRQQSLESLSSFTRLMADGRALFNPNDKSAVRDEDLQSQRLITEVDSLLSQSSFIWSHFELERLRDFANLRRLQFNFFCRGLQPDDRAQTAPLMEFVSPALGEAGSTCLYANCMVAACFNRVGELCTHFLLQAAQTAIEGQFGQAVQNELALLAIERGHTLAFDFEPCLKALLRRGPDNRSFLRSFLGFVPSSDYSGQVLALLNASAHIQDPGIASAVRLTITEVAQLQPEGPEKQTALALIQLHELRRLREQGAPLPSEDELLNGWADRRRLWIYPSLLSLLILSGQGAERTIHEAYSSLDHDPMWDSSNTNLSLAIMLGSRAQTRKLNERQCQVLIHYVRNAIPRWEPSQSSETNLGAYRLLYHLDKNNQQEYVPSLIKWEKIKIERDHLKRLRELADQERYLLLFRAYYDSAIHWGLESFSDEEKSLDIDSLDSEKRAKLAESWIREGAPIPEPLIANRKSSISAKFLELGQLLFSPPNAANPAYNDARSRFDEVARKKLPDLVKTILSLPNMPDEIRQLLSYHSHQLLAYAKLIDVKYSAPVVQRRSRPLASAAGRRASSSSPGD